MTDLPGLSSGERFIHRNAPQSHRAWQQVLEAQGTYESTRRKSRELLEAGILERLRREFPKAVEMSWDRIPQRPLDAYVLSHLASSALSASLHIAKRERERPIIVQSSKYSAGWFDVSEGGRFLMRTTADEEPSARVEGLLTSCATDQAVRKLADEMLLLHADLDKALDTFRRTLKDLSSKIALGELSRG